MNDIFRSDYRGMYKFIASNLGLYPSHSSTLIPHARVQRKMFCKVVNVRGSAAMLMESGSFEEAITVYPRNYSGLDHPIRL